MIQYLIISFLCSDQLCLLCVELNVYKTTCLALFNNVTPATETRVPYGLVNVVLRELLFGSDGRGPVPM